MKVGGGVVMVWKNTWGHGGGGGGLELLFTPGVGILFHFGQYTGNTYHLYFGKDEVVIV